MTMVLIGFDHTKNRFTLGFIFEHIIKGGQR